MTISRQTVYITAAAVLFAASMTSGSARAQVGVPTINNTLDRTLERRLPRLEDRVDSRVKETVDDELEQAGETVGETVDAELVDATLDSAAEPLETVADEAGETIRAAGETVSGATQTVQNVVSRTLRPFVSDIDPFGRAIEKNVLVVLVDSARLGEVTAVGLDVIEQREMAGLGMTLVTLEGPNSHTLAQTAVDLRRAVPEAVVDYNHIYRGAADVRGAGEAGPTDPARPDSGAAAGILRIGMIDSDVSPEHRALQESNIVRSDFVTHEGRRPLGHGTAVASLLADATSGQAEIYAASVFFQAPNHAPGATTESLVAGLDWLASERVDAINMSLAGPANALLERALLNMKKDGPMVVAAVGNNGPSGEPQYPAAYEQVIGVTAVDRDRRIFRYANRGSHVAFAALGVNVKVADAGGGWRIETGTSMASPRVAAVVAAAYRQGHTERASLLDALITGAEDLGRKGFDDIFGHGLITQPPTIVSSIRTPPQD